MTTDDQVEQSTAPEVTSAPEQSYSLEDVYKEAGITEAQPQSQAPVQQQEQRKPVEIPDAYEDSHKDFLRSMYEKQTMLEANQQQIMQKEFKHQEQLRQIKHDEEVKSLTDFIVDNAGFNDLPYDDITKSDFAYFELQRFAANDPKFKALFDARNTSPQAKAALDKAMVVVTKQIGKKYEAKVDPSLVASRRALKASQHSSATTESNSDDNSLANLTGSAFDRAWAAAISQSA